MTGILVIAVAFVAATTAMGWAVAHWHLRGADLDAPVVVMGSKPSEKDA